MNAGPERACPTCSRTIPATAHFCLHCGCKTLVAVSGWYPDPQRQAALRYWDGHSWTGNLANPETPPPTVHADVPPLAGSSASTALPGIGLAVIGFAGGVGLSILIEYLWSHLGKFGGLTFILGASQIGLWIGLVAPPIYVSLRRGTGRLSRDFGFRIRPIDIGIGILGGFVGRAASMLVALPLYAAFHNLLHDPQVAVKSQTISGITWIEYGIIICIGAPLIEELLFRGLIQTRLVKRLGAFWGIAVTSVVFGAAHLIGWTGPASLLTAAAIAGGGGVLGFLRYRTGRLGTSMVAHASFNAMALALVLASYA